MDTVIADGIIDSHHAFSAIVCPVCQPILLEERGRKEMVSSYRENECRSLTLPIVDGPAKVEFWRAR